MNDPVRFSIIIPTRQRHETLLHTLETVLGQNFENYEIVVSDNFSSPETKAVVDSFGSTKIRYFRTPKPLAMSDNWEFAVEQARGDYITVLGDDDGLLSHALTDLDTLLTELKVPILHWRPVEYFWPDFIIESRRDHIIIPVGRHNRKVNTADLLHKITTKDYNQFRDLPMIYNSFVHCHLINQIRQKTGKVFRSMAPDIHSGVELASAVKWFYSLGRPMSIIGASGKSNGAAIFTGRNKDIAKEYVDLNQESGFLLHHSLPPVMNNATAILNAFFWVREGGRSEIPVPDRKLVVQWCAEAIATQDEDEYRRAISVLHDWLEDDLQLQQWFDRDYSQQPFKPSPHYEPFPLGLSTYQGLMFLDATRFNVTNVAEAAQLYTSLFNYNRTPLVWQRHDLRTLDNKIPWNCRLRLVKQILFNGTK